MKSEENGVRQHYARPSLADAILDGLRAMGCDVDNPKPSDFGPVDHFHLGTTAESAALARLAGFTADMHVLDVGGGLGGPARMLAAEVGCRVTVVDLSPEYCAAGEELTRRMRLEALVSFRCANALHLPFEAGHFDGAWTQHSTMNIEDKDRLFREIGRVLLPGGRLAIHEIMSGPVTPIHFPVPWARKPAISFLRRPEEVKDLIVGAGFREMEWQDLTARSLEWVRQRVSASRASKGPPPLGFHLLLGPEAATMLQNQISNIEEHRLEVIHGLFERT